MKRFFRYRLVQVLLICLITGYQVQSANSQSSFGFNLTPKTDMIPLYSLQPFNWNAIQAEDARNDKNGHYPRMAVTQDVQLDLHNSGIWKQLSNGDRIWRIRVKSADALGLIFSFENLLIPQGASISVYNDDQSDILGPFDASYSPASGVMAIGVVKGETITIEYYEPFSVQGQGHFTIKEVGHAYRMVDINTVSRDFGDSDACQVNVNCTPEGTSWQDEKRGVARILLKDGANWGWCTGSLVNNTAEDCYPYFLTAFHCGETASASDRSQWFFYFNYESSGCSNGSNPVPNPYSPPAGSPTTQGCQLVAHSNDGGGSTGSDFQLLHLNNLTASNISTWNLYFNGWDRANTAATGGVGIHHPSGDIKKISTYTGTLVSTTWGGTPNTHWRVTWTATTNGHGVTEGGSSGSPLFNNSGRIVGTLTGGGSYCSTPTAPDSYGKMSYHWNSNASPTGGHLSQFLDPLSSGVTVLDGTYSPCTPTAPNCAISASATTVNVGQSVDFYDNSSGVPTSWSWNFGGGTPATSTVQNPTGVVYNTPGTYTVTMTATNAYGSCNTSMTITVNASTGCDTVNWYIPGTLTLYTTTGTGTCTNNGFISGWNRYCDAAKVQRFDNYSPYTHVTGGIFYIYAAHESGASSTVNFNVYDEVAGEPGSVIGQVSVSLADLATAVPAGGGLITVSFTGPVNVGGNPFYMGVEMVNFDSGDSLAIVTNTAGDAPVSDQSWEQWDTGDWYSMNASWGVDFDFFIHPMVTDLPVTANMTSPGGTSGCTGTAFSFDGSTSVNATGYDWTLTGGTPAAGTASTFNSTLSTAGSYTVYFEAYGACGGYDFVSQALTVSASPSVTSSSTPENCGGNDGTITATATGGSGSGYMYSLNGGTPQASGSYTGLSAGTYSVSVEDGNGCTAVTSVTVTNNSGGVTVTTSTVADPCNSGNGSLTASATGGTGSYTYSIDGVNYQASATFTGLSAGTYTVFAMDGSGCAGNINATISANTYTLTVTVSNTPENCGGSDGTITVSASGGSPAYQYSINGGSSFQGTGSFTSVSSGTYSIVVEDQYGCSGTASTTVSNTGGPTLSGTTNVNPGCAGTSTGSITVTATGATQYSINGGTTYQASNIFNGLPAGTYNVVASDGGSCNATTTVTLSDPSSVVATAVATNAGCSTGGSITAAGSGGTPSYQYSIDNGSTFQTSAVFSGVAAGSYQVVVQDANGCLSAPYSVSVGGSTAITLSITPTDETCSGNNGSIVITATGGNGGPYNYSIDGGSTSQSSGNFGGLNQGSYSIMVNDGAGCTATGSANLSDVGAVNGTLTPSQSMCSGNSVTLTATGGGTYLWTPGGQTSASVAVSPSTTTTYSVTIDNGTCTEILNTTVTVTSTPTTSVSSNVTICNGQSTTLTASGGVTYQWTPGGQTTSSVTVSPSTTTTYQVTAYNGTCAGNTVSVVVTVNTAPVAVASASPLVVSLSNATVNFSSAGSTPSGVTYVWDYADGNTSSTANPTYTFTAAGTYDVILIVSNSNCSTTDTVTVTVIDDTKVDEISLSEAVSVYPNPGNGQFNLSFALNQPKNVKVKVYNAIGALVASNTYPNTSVGVHQLNLQDAASGIYFFKISSGAEEVTLKVSILR